jgi:hypothetical protein
MNNKNIISNKFDLNWSTMFFYNEFVTLIIRLFGGAPYGQMVRSLLKAPA